MSILMRYLFLILFLISCGSGENEAKPHAVSLSELSSQKALYLKLVKKQQKEFGWVNFKCDGLLFNSLLAASFLNVEIEKARDSSGQWFRTPEKTCYDLGQSSSDISKDQLTGLMWYGFLQDKEELLSELYTWGDSHKWVMGDGPKDYTYFLPWYQNTLRALIGKAQNIPETFQDPLKDHQRHIEALNIILRGEENGAITNAMLRILKKYGNASPSNALFSYGLARFGDVSFEKTMSLLSRFPKERLPTSKDWCTRWLWERDEHKDDWKPCKEEAATHSGGDFIFIVTLLERSFGPKASH